MPHQPVLFEKGFGQVCVQPNGAVQSLILEFLPPFPVGNFELHYTLETTNYNCHDVSKWFQLLKPSDSAVTQKCEIYTKQHTFLNLDWICTL